MSTGSSRLIRIALHIPAGAITAFACILDWMLGLACLVTFIVYEINEDRHLHDKAFIDILGYAFGLFFVAGWLVVLKYYIIG